ncbi:MAG: DUF4258 domain-containing protein [Thermodesulfobacteriota bacterium]
MIKNSWPEWWAWDIELTSHLIKRMEDRSFNEVELRKMLSNARNHKIDVVEGRWIIETRHERHPWHVIVEPDEVEKLLVIITAYPVWEKSK